ncbi:hypothetical protein BGZ91_011133 [Linnemannia elongata]|nr:hypothetical protein BGZ91_011133 [Linnemannia elongata]
MAQVTPSAVQDMAFGRTGSDLFIQGGYVAINSVSQSVSSQLIALDLSSPWAVTSPAWRALANGTASRSFSAVSLPTNQTFLTFKYLDPNQYTITAYDVTANTWSLPTPVTTVTDILSYGLRPVVDPSTGGCDRVLPFDKYVDCSVVFGGRTSIVTPIFTGSIHLLDITTGAWSTGLPQSTPRIYAACTLVGDQFVAWGGSADANNTLPSVQPIVFDTTLKKWVDAYKPPQYYIDNPPKKPTPGSGSGGGGGSGSGGGGTSGGGGSGGGSNNNGDGTGSGSDSTHSGLAPIIGGVVGGLVVIGAIVGFLVYRRRQNRRLNEVQEQVSLQRMVIEAERSNKGVAQNSSNHHNDGGNGGAGAYSSNYGGVGSGFTNSNNGGKDNISTTITYPTPPAYSSNNSNNNTNAYHHQDKKSAFSPHLPHKQEFAHAPNSSMVYTAAVSSPSMSSSAAGLSSSNNDNNYQINYITNYNDSTNNLINNNNPRGPQSTKTSGPQAVKILNGPQEYHSPAGRAPQTIANGGNDAYAYYHEQESGRKRQNHPQEGDAQY